GRAKSGCAVVDPSGAEGRDVEGIDLGAALRREGRVLLHASRVEPVDPEDGVVDAVPDPVGASVLGKLHDAAEPESAESGIVERGGASDVRNADAGVVDHGEEVLRPRGTSSRSSAERFQRALSAAAAYVLWRNSSSTSSGEVALRTSSYGRRNSPSGS